MFRRLAFSSAEPACAPGHSRRSAAGAGRFGGSFAVASFGGTAGASDDLTPRQRRSVVAAMVLLHAGAAAWLLLLPARPPLTVAPPATLRVDWIAAPSVAPEPPLPLPPDPTPVPPKPTPRPVTPKPRPLIAAPAATVPAAMVTSPAPTPPVVDSTPAPVETAPAPAPASPPAPATAPPPKTLPPEAVQYLVPPAPVYPKISSRNGEAGRVLVRVYIDEGGMPRSVQIAESSGHGRLDEAARVAVQATRFKPYAENGRPTAGWAFIPLTFDLEK